MHRERFYTLTASCPDRVGIVAAVSGFFAQHGGWILETTLHSEPPNEEGIAAYFMRLEVKADSLPFDLEGLRAAFKPVADEFKMTWRVSDSARRKRVVILVSCVFLGFSWAGWRAQARLADHLPEVWEGKDVELVGVVAALPQRFEQGERFTFDVEKVLTPDARVPRRISLSWYRSWDDLDEDAPALAGVGLDAQVAQVLEGVDHAGGGGVVQPHVGGQVREGLGADLPQQQQGPELVGAEAEGLHQAGDHLLEVPPGRRDEHARGRNGESGLGCGILHGGLRERGFRGW